MKKYLIALLALSGLVGVVYADKATVNTPKSERGEEVHPFYGGYKYALVSGTTEIVVCSSANAPCLLAQMYMSTGPSTTTILLRDTAAADGAGTNQMFPNRRFEIDCYAARPMLTSPIRANNGITAKLSAGSTGEEVVILYLEKL